MNRIATIAVSAIMMVAGTWLPASAQTSGKTNEPIHCPSKFDFPARPANTPPDDVLGMRQGTKLSDAILFLRCRTGSHAVVTEETRGIANSFGQKVRQVVTITEGDPRSRPYNYAQAMMSGETGTPDFDFVTEKIMFWSLGAQPDEVVWGIWRSQFYKSGETQAVTSLVQQLTEKYGKPNNIQDNQGYTLLSWRYDSAGHLLPQNNGCGGVVAVVDGQHEVREPCGLTVEATIQKLSNNPLLAQGVSVGVIDQSKYLTAVKEFERVAATAQKQQQLDEAAKAAKSSPPPKF